MCDRYRRSVAARAHVYVSHCSTSRWGGVNLADNAPKERRNPFVYTDEQFSKMCKFYIVVWHFYHTWNLARTTH